MKKNRYFFLFISLAISISGCNDRSSMPTFFKSIPQEFLISEQKVKAIKDVMVFDDIDITQRCIHYSPPHPMELTAESQKWAFSKETHQLVSYNSFIHVSLTNFDDNVTAIINRYGLPYRVYSEKKDPRPYMQEWTIKNNPNLKQDGLYALELRYFTYGSLASFTIYFMDEKRTCDNKATE